MLAPFVIMVAGSLEPGARFRDAAWFPGYVFSDAALWPRYIQAKYHDDGDLLRAAWGSPDLDFLNVPPPQDDDAAVEEWRRFAADEQPAETLFGTGFCNVDVSPPYHNNRAFQRWLIGRFDGIAGLNRALGTTFRAFAAVRPPNISLTGPSLQGTPFVREFLAFSRDDVPDSQKFAWDAGGYFRAVFLPRTIGPSIADYNARFGTTFRSYAEVPFPAAAPEAGWEPWFTFVSKLLRPDFVGLTPEGEARLRNSGLRKNDFVRLASQPGDLAVQTLDRRFAAWVERESGRFDARIPQAALDAAAFHKEKGFWRKTFLLQNYQYVLDGILLQGTALRNTVILVAGMITGALLVNPLAAYALSRFKLPQAYTILLLFLVTIAFPAEVMMIPVFLQLKEFHLLNTFGALILPGLANGFSIFLLKGFFDSLPKELYEAGELDGANEWQMFWLIAMNLSKPILAVIALGAFVSAYGAFFYALILAPDPKMWTLMVYVYQLQQTAGSSVVYAALILTAIPTLLIFVLCQNLILRGIVVPAEK